MALTLVPTFRKLLVMVALELIFPDAVTFVLTNNPVVSDIDAVADPSDIRDKFNPTTPDAGTLIRLEPSPAKDPVNEPVNGDVISVNWPELEINPEGNTGDEPDGPIGPLGPVGPALFTIIVFKIYTFIYIKDLNQSESKKN